MVTRRELSAWERMDSDPEYDPGEIVDGAAYDEYADEAGYYPEVPQAKASLEEQEGRDPLEVAREFFEV